MLCILPVSKVQESSHIFPIELQSPCVSKMFLRRITILSICLLCRPNIFYPFGFICVAYLDEQDPQASSDHHPQTAFSIVKADRDCQNRVAEDSILCINIESNLRTMGTILLEHLSYQPDNHYSWYRRNKATTETGWCQTYLPAQKWDKSWKWSTVAYRDFNDSKLADARIRILCIRFGFDYSDSNAHPLPQHPSAWRRTAHDSWH